MISPAIPASSIPEELLKKLQSEKYDRIVMNVSADYEGKETFALVKKKSKKLHNLQFHPAGYHCRLCNSVY